MAFQRAIVKLVSDGITISTTAPNKSFTVTNPPATILQATEAVSISGVIVDYATKEVTFDYFASVNYTDNDGVQRFAFVSDTVTSAAISDLCISTSLVPAVTASVNVSYDSATTSIVFAVSYVINYNKCEDTLVRIDVQQ